jgi:hypothetical protein
VLRNNPSNSKNLRRSAQSADKYSRFAPFPPVLFPVNPADPVILSNLSPVSSVRVQWTRAILSQFCQFCHSFVTSVLHQPGGQERIGRRQCDKIPNPFSGRACPAGAIGTIRPRKRARGCKRARGYGTPLIDHDVSAPTKTIELFLREMETITELRSRPCQDAELRGKISRPGTNYQKIFRQNGE